MTAPQNVYDDPIFFAGYAGLRRTGTGLNEALEQPALRALLPPLAGLSVLDLGCGFGDFARWARGQGAASILGLDVSARMLAEAATRTDDAAIDYRRQAIEDLVVPAGSFDLAVSSLALHYVADYPAALAHIAAALTRGGGFVFSVEHPICTALPEQRWVTDAAGEVLHWPIDRYRDEGPRRTKWFVEGVVKYHRTVETYVEGLLSAGFALRALREPAPAPGPAAALVPGIERHRRRPPFLVLAATR